MERRSFIKYAVGAGLAGISASLLKPKEELSHLEEFIHKLGYFHDGIETLADQRPQKEIDSIKQSASNTTKSWDTYQEYAIRFFRETEFIDEDKALLVIPHEIRNLLAPIIPWLIAQESKYSKIARSSAWAVWSTQIIEAYAQYKTEILLKYLPLQVQECFHMFEGIRNTFVKKIDIPQFAHTFGLSEKEMNILLALCMLNAYNTGQNRMVAILSTFQSRISPSLANKRKDKSVEWLFHLMTTLAYHFEWNGRYWKYSYEYPRLCLAYAKRLGTWEIKSAYWESPKVVMRNIQERTQWILEKGGNLWTGVVLGGVAIAGMETFLDKKQTPAFLSDRRDFLKIVGILGLWAIAGNYAPEFFDDLKDFTLPQPHNHSMSENKELIEREIEKYYAEHPTFFSKTSLQNQQYKEQEIQKQWQFLRNYPKRVIPKIKKLPNSLAYKITNQDVQAGLEKKWLHPIEKETALWRLYGIWDQKGINPQYAFLRPQTETILKTITTRFQEILSLSGIAQGWSIRPVVSSLIRTVEDNASYGGNDNSVHLRGLGMDISYLRFDLIHTDGNVYLDLHNSNNSKLSTILKYAQSLMIQVIAQLDREKKLIFTNETKSQAPHYHISVV